jgi:hypothetical protein
MMKPVTPYPLCVKIALMVLLGTLPVQVLAESRDETPDMQKAEAQPSVKAWLELQSSGEAASEQPQPLSGPAMDRVHERYLKNFTHPIPPYFEHVDRISY